MRRFQFLILDNKTQLQMVLCDCSYNQACYYLQGQDVGELLKVTTVNVSPLPYKVSELKYEKATFIYDEQRGFLMQR